MNNKKSIEDTYGSNSIPASKEFYGAFKKEFA